MDIRVHKALGYGLTDLKEADERINWDAPLLDYGALSGHAYNLWLSDKYNESKRLTGKSWVPFSLDFAMLRGEPELLRKDLRDACLTYETEGGMPQVMVLAPLGVSGWSRFDDPIDYMTETYLGHGQEHHFEVFGHGIHPFNGVYMDARTGDKLPHSVLTWIRVKTSMESRGEKLSADKLAALDEIVRDETPFTSWAEAEKYTVPQVPEEIRDIAEFGQLFTDPLTWVQLRPVLYTYWA